MIILSPVVKCKAQHPSCNGQRTMFSKAEKKGSKKKKWSIAEFLLTDSKNGSEKHGDVHFAEFLANKIRYNFLCPK